MPAGTTVLNLTYADLSLHVTYPNGSTEWLPISASGTVNLFSLINMSQTLASTTIPIGSVVDTIQFTIADVDAVVHGLLYNVTVLSNTLVVTVANSRIDQVLSGVLIDFNPTLIQIQATDANGARVDYYVLAPNATATVVTDLSEDEVKVGTIVELRENHRVRLVHVEETFMDNVRIDSASLSVTGNATSLSATIQNDGTVPFRVFGLTLTGEFNTTQSWTQSEHDHMRDEAEEDEGDHEVNQPHTIPFKLNETSLTPLFGTAREHDDEHERWEEEREHGDDHDYAEKTSLTLPPGQHVTVTFTGVIALYDDDHDHNHPPTLSITPIVANEYTLQLMGEGSQTFTVQATS